MPDPALFYLHVHSQLDTLDTPKFAELFDRASTIFYEMISETQSEIGRYELALNQFTKNGKLPTSIQFTHADELVWNFHVQKLKNSGKKVIFERTQPPPYNWMHEHQKAYQEFWSADIEKAIKTMTQFLAKGEKFQTEREKNVAKQIEKVPATVLVTFGAHHIELPKLVETSRPVEVHYPCPGYKVDYDTQMLQEFRKTGKINEELYLRAMMEFAVLFGTGNKLKATNALLVAHRYAGMFTTEQIRSYPTFKAERAGSFEGKIFQGFIKKLNLPSIDQILEETKVES